MKTEQFIILKTFNYSSEDENVSESFFPVSRKLAKINFTKAYLIFVTSISSGASVNFLTDGNF